MAASVPAPGHALLRHIRGMFALTPGQTEGRAEPPFIGNDRALTVSRLRAVWHGGCSSECEHGPALVAAIRRTHDAASEPAFIRAIRPSERVVIIFV